MLVLKFVLQPCPNNACANLILVLEFFLNVYISKTAKQTKQRSLVWYREELINSTINLPFPSDRGSTVCVPREATMALVQTSFDKHTRARLGVGTIKKVSGATARFEGKGLRAALYEAPTSPVCQRVVESQIPRYCRLRAMKLENGRVWLFLRLKRPTLRHDGCVCVRVWGRGQNAFGTPLCLLNRYRLCLSTDGISLREN